MDESPQLRYLLVPVGMGIMVGLVVGVILAWQQTNKAFWIVGAILGCGFLGFLLSNWFIQRRADWYYYQNVSDNVANNAGEPVILSLHIHDDQGRDESFELRGLTRNEWQMLGVGVRRHKNYSSRVLQEIFGTNRGGIIYDLITELLKDKHVKILVDKGTGVGVTGRGWKFFEHLENENYEILAMLKTPPPSPMTERV